MRKRKSDKILCIVCVWASVCEVEYSACVSVRIIVRISTCENVYTVCVLVYM